MLKSVKNFRPLGGNPEDSNFSQEKSCDDHLNLRVYRSGRMDKISEDDLTKLHKEVGIRSVIDLRNFGSEYIHEDGMKLIDGNTQSVNVVDIREMEMTSSDDIIWKRKGSDVEPIKHYMVEFFGTTCLRKMMASELFPRAQRYRLLALWVMWRMLGTKSVSKYIKKLIKSLGFITIYKMTVDLCGVSIRTVLQLLNDEENLPAVICCHHGRDRTGMMSALLLAMSGTDRRKIFEDYNAAQSNPDDTIQILLDYIDEKYSSVHNYLDSIGFSFSDQATLTQRLRESNALR